MVPSISSTLFSNFVYSLFLVELGTDSNTNSSNNRIYQSPSEQVAQSCNFHTDLSCIYPTFTYLPPIYYPEHHPQSSDTDVHHCPLSWGKPSHIGHGSALTGRGRRAQWCWDWGVFRWRCGNKSCLGCRSQRYCSILRFRKEGIVKCFLLGFWREVVV
jgi:hypothetical protein